MGCESSGRETTCVVSTSMVPNWSGGLVVWMLVNGKA